MRCAINNDAAASVCVHLAHGINALCRAGQWILDGVVAVQNPARWEVWSVDVLAEIVNGELWVRDQGDGGIGNFAKVVWRNVRSHADGDARGAVDEQVRQTRRKNARLLLRAVVVRREVDCLVIDVGEHLASDGGEACLGVTHRSCGVAVN